MKTYILFLFLMSCAGNEVKETQPSESEIQNKRQDLGLPQEVEEKFKITKKEPVKIPKVEKPTGTKATTAPKSVSKPVVNKTEIIVKEKSPEVTKKLELPDDYPEKYRNYDKIYKSVWAKFNPSYLAKKERIKMRVSYLGLGMGSMVMEAGERVLVGDKDAYTFKARLKTADFYSYIYELDDKLEAQVMTKEFLPLRYSLIQRESKKEIDDIQLFDREKYLLYYRYRRWRKDKKSLTKKNEDISIPKYALDPFSLLYFVRGLPLSIGQKYEFPVVTRDKLWLFKLHVVEQEEIKTINGKKMAYRIEAQIGEEGSFIKKGELNLWLGVDPGHILWQMKVGTKIGSLYTRVSEYSSQ